MPRASSPAGARHAEPGAVGYLDESHVLLFLVQVSILLGLSRALGILLERRGQPSVTAEILVGVLLGPTVLGRFLPQVHQAIFPADAVSGTCWRRWPGWGSSSSC